MQIPNPRIKMLSSQARVTNYPSHRTFYSSQIYSLNLTSWVQLHLASRVKKIFCRMYYHQYFLSILLRAWKMTLIHQISWYMLDSTTGTRRGCAQTVSPTFIPTVSPKSIPTASPAWGILQYFSAGSYKRWTDSFGWRIWVCREQDFLLQRIYKVGAPQFQRPARRLEKSTARLRVAASWQPAQLVPILRLRLHQGNGVFCVASWQQLGWHKRCKHAGLHWLPLVAHNWLCASNFECLALMLLNLQQSAELEQTLAPDCLRVWFVTRLTYIPLTYWENLILSLVANSGSWPFCAATALF